MREPATRAPRSVTARILSIATVLVVGTGVVFVVCGGRGTADHPDRGVEGTGETGIAGHDASRLALPSAVTVEPTSSKPVPAIDGSAAVRRSFDALAALPSGESAIALGRELEEALTPTNAAAFVAALLATDSRAVERTAHAALARTAGAEVIAALVSVYGATPAERRGRILEVLEDVQNAAATETLVKTVEGETNEKRSPLLVSAMRGLANLSTSESVGYLLRQVATDNEVFALAALERARTAQAREMIRAASLGNKDSIGLAPEILAALARIAAARAP